MVSAFTLNTGVSMPAFGLGTWQSPKGAVAAAVEEALKLGYTHIDCAAIYGNESEVGEGIKKSGVPREKIWVTSKLWNSEHHPDDVPKALEKTLSELGVGYLDLYLMHYPGATGKDANGNSVVLPISYCDTWAAMEKLVESGKVKAIGISNFCKSELDDLLAHCSIKPAVHQFELHPYLPQHDFLALHKKLDIHVTAYSPFGNQNYAGAKEPNTLEHPAVVEVAKKTGKTPAQVLIAWALTRGTSVIPKTVTKARLIENLKGAGETLGEEEMKIIDGIDIRARYADFGKQQGYWCYRDLECPGYNPAEGK